MYRYLFYIPVLLLVLLNSSCSSSSSKAQTTIDNAIEAHGGNKLQQARVAFDFRDRHYTYTRQKENFTYTREFTDSLGQVRDVLTNSRFYRLIDGDTATLTDERVKAYSNSVNSVLYFSVLPFGLNDPAVNKAYLGETEIEGEPYHLVKVTFDQEGGGEDFEDQFLYWINSETNTMDYLAYSYKTDGGGVRFRKAVNPRVVEGVRFQDYINYKPKTKEASLEEMENLYKKGELEVLSEINLENIKVEPFNRG